MVIEELERHEHRRNNGIATVSVLLGPIGGGLLAWRRWATSRRRPVVHVHQPSTVASCWLECICADPELVRLALRVLAQHRDRDSEEFYQQWLYKTAYDREQFWHSVVSVPYQEIVRCLCDSLAPGTPTRDGRTLAQHLQQHCGGLLRAVEALVCWLQSIGESRRLPAVIFQPATENPDLNWWLSCADQAVRWALQVPAVAVGVTVTVTLWQQFLAHAPPSRTRDLLQEGIIVLPREAPASVSQRLQSAGATAVAPSLARMLSENGADTQVVDAAVETLLAINSAHNSTHPKADDPARSAAERFLYEFLQLMPQTAGRWELNARLPFSFGGRTIEVDLLERSRQLVIEIDGYYHFQDKEAYRRDRAKDYLLQKHGYVVLRFLAEDIVDKLELVRDRILDACSFLPQRNAP